MWWKSALDREIRGQSVRRAKEANAAALKLVELKAPVTVASALIEIELEGRRRLRFSGSTAPEVIAWLIPALEARA